MRGENIADVRPPVFLGENKVVEFFFENLSSGKARR
jgi:hypothetical protein